MRQKTLEIFQWLKAPFHDSHWLSWKGAFTGALRRRIFNRGKQKLIYKWRFKPSTVQGFYFYYGSSKDYKHFQPTFFWKWWLTDSSAKILLLIFSLSYIMVDRIWSKKILLYYENLGPMLHVLRSLIIFKYHVFPKLFDPYWRDIPISKSQ